VSGPRKRRPPPYRAPESVEYWRPRRRRAAPAVAAGVIGLVVLVGGQAAVGALTPVEPVAGAALPAPAPSGTTPPEATVAVEPGPTRESAAPVLPPVAGPPAAGTGDPTTGAATREDRPELLATVPLPVGAVVDEAAADRLAELAEELRAPGAPAVVLEGVATGPDEATALTLAEERAEVVRDALVDRGVPAVLLRTGAVRDEALRGVRVLTDG
jgi:hypothetical protein